MYRLDAGLKAIIEKARERGFVTVQQAHEWLPDEGGDPAMVDNLIRAMDVHGFDFVEDPEIPLEPEPIEEEVREEQAEKAAATLGDLVFTKFPWAMEKPELSESPYELLLNNTWRPTLSITGAEGLPDLVNAGNVQLPFATLKLSFRLPPTCDADAAAAAVKAILEADPPPNAKVEFSADSAMAGWNAPEVAPWLEASMQRASEKFFDKPSMYMGTGGTIPFMGMLGERFPEAQFLITGLLGPNSNAHGPNEFLHIATGKRLTSCVAQVLMDHYTEFTARAKAA